MENQIENVIAIRQRDIHSADRAFADFMLLTEQCLNEKTKQTKGLFKDCGGQKMEKVALEALQEVAPQTPFRKEEIKIVSGAKFPDIQAEQYYGVEVKTTQRDAWTSLGSSIVESTRIKDVSMIYLLFAKMGGEAVEFRCRPYEDCLFNISLTHQPRYQIDMDLEATHRKNIFQKMQVDYNTFRVLEEKEKIARVKQYFRSISNPEHEMQWWIGEECSVPMTVRFLNDLSVDEKKEITAEMFVLFPEVFSNSPTKFQRAALWLCTRHSLICSNIRDFFTAGGKVTSLGGMTFSDGVPQIVKKLYDNRNFVRSMLKHPSECLESDMCEMWSLKCPPKCYETYWLNALRSVFKQTPSLQGIDVDKVMGYWSLAGRKV